MAWRSLFRQFSLYLRLIFPLLLYLDFFHLISFHGNTCFIFIVYAILSLFFVDIFIFDDGLFTKKEFILSISCVSGTIVVSALNVRRFIEVKTSTSVFLIHYFDDCCLFLESLSRCWSCLSSVFRCILVALLRTHY